MPVGRAMRARTFEVVLSLGPVPLVGRQIGLVHRDRLIERSGVSVRLPCWTFFVLAALLSRAPEPLGNEELFIHLFREDAEGGPDQPVCRFIANRLALPKRRRQFAQVGVGIVNHVGAWEAIDLWAEGARLAA
jgi:hypothetical protein